MSVPGLPVEGTAGGLAVLRNRPFLLLWLSQLATQVGGNMVLYGLTVVILEATSLSSAVSALFLTFLVPAVLFSAVAGVYVDRLDRRVVLVVTNVLRAALLLAMWAVGPDLGLLLLFNVILSTLTVFFAPAEAAMIPALVPRDQLISANGLFTLTLNAAFALGYALLGPLIVTISGTSELVIIVVAVLYGVAAVFCLTLPADPPGPLPAETPLETVAEAGEAVGSTLGQLREGIGYIRTDRSILWSLIYLGIAASLVGVIGVLGPSFAEQTLGLAPKDLVVVVLPLGMGIVMGVMLLNRYGHYLPRRRAIEGGLITLGLLIFSLTATGPLARMLVGSEVLRSSEQSSLIALVVAIAFLCGMAYGVVAISSQTQLQEDIPAEVRGRVFGVLNMLVSVASFLPIIVVGPISDLFGPTRVIFAVAILVFTSGLLSIMTRGPLRPAEERATAGTMVEGTALDPIGVALRTDADGRSRDRDRRPGAMRAAPVGEPAGEHAFPPPDAE